MKLTLKFMKIMLVFTMFLHLFLPMGGMKVSADPLEEFPLEELPLTTVTEAVYQDTTDLQELTTEYLFEDDFEEGDTSRWILSNGAGKPDLPQIIEDDLIPDNKMLYANTGDEVFAIPNGTFGEDYIYEANVKKGVSGSYTGILARYQDANNYYMLQLGDERFSLSKRVNGTTTTLGEYMIPIQINNWYTMRLTVEGSLIKGYIDGQLIFDVTDTALISGKPGFRSKWERSALDSVVIVNIPTDKIGAPNAPTATAITASSAELSWGDMVTGATYRLYRSTGAQKSYTEIYYGGEREYKDMNLSPNSTYYYKVTVEQNRYESKASAITQIRTEKMQLPESVDQLPGIVSAYKFDETSGTIATPTVESQHKTEAQIKGGATWSEGRKGGAINLNGTDGYVLLPSGIAKDLTDMTITAWVNQDTLRTWARIFDIGHDTTSYMFLSPKGSSGDTRFVLKNGGDEQVTAIKPAIEKTGEWMHYGVTVSGSTAILYINGQEAGRNDQISISPSDFGNTAQNYIGKSLWPDPYLDGKVDDFYLFNRALSPAEIALFTADENAANVQKDKEALTLGNTTAITENIILPTTGSYGSFIEWESSDPEKLTPQGIVNRPSVGQPDANVTLTATLTQGNASDTKVFNIIVKADLKDKDAVKADLKAIVIPNEKAVTAKLTLPLEGAKGTQITWHSSDEKWLKSDGMVRRPATNKKDEKVTLTATLTKGSAKESRKFHITIKKQDEYSAYLFAYAKQDGQIYYAVSRNGATWTEIGTGSGVTEPIKDNTIFKLNSLDKWYRYSYEENAWKLYSSLTEKGPWNEDPTSITMPAEAKVGSFKRITEEEWTYLVHTLSEPAKLDIVQLTTKVGKPPRLPSFMKVDYTNRLYTNATIVWDKIPKANYAQAGTFQTQGTIKGSSTRVTATIEVFATGDHTSSVRNGEYWYDTDGAMIQAHGGTIVQSGDTYYWFGEDKTHNSAVLNGVSVYSSKDLKTWDYRNMVISSQSHPELASSKIERPKVLYNKKTKKYVLWGHWEESGNYNQANVVVAVSDTIDGNYEFLYRFRPDGKDSRDYTVFQDDDGQAYLFSSTNTNSDMNVYRLTDDYLYVEEYMYTMLAGQHRESPAIAKKDGTYYLITSGTSGWYPNQGKYTTTQNISDPNGWSELKLIGDPATYYTQSAFVFTIQGSEETSYVYVGDRWNPSNLRTSQYIWLPLELENGRASMDYVGEWDLDASSGQIEPSRDVLISQGLPSKGSSEASGFGAAKANDGDLESYFDWGTTSFPATWEVDLQKVYDLSRIDLSWREWNGSEVYYTYKIEGSNDKQNYTLIIDQSKNKTTSFNSHQLDSNFRYVRVTVLGEYGHTNNADKLVTWYRGLHEVKIYTSDLTVDAPAGLSAEAVSTSEGNTSIVRLKWNSVAYSSTYELYRAEEVEGEYKVIYRGKAQAFEDTGLSIDKEYYYKVKAIYGGESSDFSEPVHVKTFAVSDGLLMKSNTEDIPLQVDDEGNPSPLPLRVNGKYVQKDGLYYDYRYVNDGDGFKQYDIYTSTDGRNWTFKKTALDRTSHPELAQCKFEAMNVTLNEDNELVFWFHYENNKDYSLGRAAVMSGLVGEDLTFHGSFRPAGNDSRDITFFKDDDGTGYIISSGNTNADLFLYQLTPDLLSVEKQVLKIYENKHREAPSLIKKDGVYYLFTSEAAGWYPSQGMYSSTTSIEGPWTELRPIGNKSTFSAQSGGVLRIAGTEADSYLMAANRWVRNEGEASQIWLPLTLQNGYASYEFYESVLYNMDTGVVVPMQHGNLLSQGKPATAGSTSSTSSAEFANDGDYTTSWVAASNTWPSEWTVDLGQEFLLSRIQISWYLHNGSEGYHQYRIETSSDGVHYETVLDRMDNKTYGFTSDVLTNTTARYVKVVLVGAVLHNNPNNWYTPQLGEVRVFGR